MIGTTSRATILAALVSFTAHAADVTGLTGGGQPFDNMQPSLVLNEFVVQSGVFPSSDPNDPNPANVMGSVRLFAGTFAPYNAPLAQGQTINIASNTALFSLLQNTYGGNGITTYALPNLTGTAAVHAGTGPFLLGQQSGVQNQTLTQAQLPAHTHSVPGSPNPTGSTGGNQPFDNRQPSLGLNYIVATNPGHAPGTTGAHLGQVSLFAGSFAPGGFQFAEGQLLSVAGNAALFDVLGNTYGGDGVATFALPDLRGRTAIGAGQGPGLSNHALGAVGGAAATSLTTAQLPAHDHTLPPSADLTGQTGGNQPVDNMQPFQALHYMIALEGIFPAREGDGDVVEETLLGEILLYAGDEAPDGFAFAEGQLIPIGQNTALFQLIQNTYGGDGTTTFALPDLRGRTVIGSGGEWDLGEVFGSEQFVLGVDQLPQHLHTLDGATAIPEPRGLALLLGAGGFLLLVLRYTTPAARRRAMSAAP
jgi:microcystin-dependent protein